jgi:glucose/arabinose dehydrogenase
MVSPSEDRIRAPMRFAHRVVPVLIIAGTTLVGCVPAPEDAQLPPPTTASGGITAVATGLDAPWSIAFHRDTPLVSERDSGRILELDEHGHAREVGRIERVRPRGEGGLLGIATHADDLYVYFTADGENRVERYPLQGRAGALALGEAEVVADGLPAAGNHNGGRIAFGPDGMLYITVGDAGDRDSAQDVDALSGKILRIHPDGSIPTDNPFDDSPVYSLGHRNPQGLAWSADGTMYASEFGQDTWDELNLIEAGGDYGWPTVEGVAGDERYIDPIAQWRPQDASPSGMAIADGRLWIANLRGERLREVLLEDPAVQSEHVVGEYGRLRDAVVAPDGALWVLTNNTDGRGDPVAGDDRVLRIDSAAP